MIGEERFNSLPRFQENVFDRPPNIGAYSALVGSDMKFSVMLFDRQDTFEFIALAILPEEHYLLDFNGEPNERSHNYFYTMDDGDRPHILVYMFLGDTIGTCRHGRSMYSGPFTLMIDRLPFTPQSDPMFLPLHNFIAGRFPVRQLEKLE
jgi:hypothetical protein